MIFRFDILLPRILAACRWIFEKGCNLERYLDRRYQFLTHIKLIKKDHKSFLNQSPQKKLFGIKTKAE